MATLAPPLDRRELTESSCEPLAVDMKRSHGFGAPRRCDESLERGVPLRRIGCEHGHVSFEHQVNPLFKQLLNAPQVADQFLQRPFLRIKTPIERRVIKSRRHALDVFAVLVKAAEKCAT